MFWSFNEAGGKRVLPKTDGINMRDHYIEATSQDINQKDKI